jgi:hypothetical protein
MNTLTGTKEFLQVSTKSNLKEKKAEIQWLSAIMMQKE